jgi:predicted transcriptional regulator
VRSNYDDAPAAYVADGTWPHARLRPDAPVSAFYGQAIARRLNELIAEDGRSLRTLATVAGVNHATISRLKSGLSMVDFGTIARLEAALGKDIWPGMAAVRAWQDSREPGSSAAD